MKASLIFFLAPLLIFSQKQKIQLLNQNDNQPLSFVEIQYGDEIQFSDKKGFINIDYVDAYKQIEILDNSYIPNQFFIDKETKIINLKSNEVILDELLISKKPRTIISPQTKKIKDFFFISPELVFFNEITFNSEYYDKYLRKLSFKSIPEIYSKSSNVLSGKEIERVREKIKNTTQVLRVNIYNHNKNKLYSSAPIEYKANEKRTFEIEIDEDILITKNSIFIEIQVIGALDENGMFFDDVKNISIRPQQTQAPREEYKVSVFLKEGSKQIRYVDVVKDRRWPESFVNFGFELEDRY